MAEIKQEPKTFSIFVGQLGSMNPGKGIIVDETWTVKQLRDHVHKLLYGDNGDAKCTLSLFYKAKPLLQPLALLGADIGLDDCSSVGYRSDFTLKYLDEKPSPLCSICLVTDCSKSRVTLMSCMHGFFNEKICTDCAKDLTTCPFCRKTISKKAYLVDGAKVKVV